MNSSSNSSDSENPLPNRKIVIDSGKVIKRYASFN